MPEATFHYNRPEFWPSLCLNLHITRKSSQRHDFGSLTEKKRCRRSYRLKRSKKNHFLALFCPACRLCHFPDQAAALLFRFPSFQQLLGLLPLPHHRQDGASYPVVPACGGFLPGLHGREVFLLRAERQFQPSGLNHLIDVCRRDHRQYPPSATQPPVPHSSLQPRHQTLQPGFKKTLDFPMNERLYSGE